MRAQGLAVYRHYNCAQSHQNSSYSGVYYHSERHDIPQLFNIDDFADASRPKERMLTPEERIKRQDFSEVEEVLDKNIIQEECKRCLRCDMEWLERIGEPLP